MAYKKELDYFEVFPWNKNFEIGNPAIDEQHKQLVQLINKLALTLTFESEISLTQAFEDLAEYAKYHFAQEESVWGEYFMHDEWFVHHQENHNSFIPQVLAIQEKNQEKSLHDTLQKIIQFLIRWLAFHIIDEDKRMALVIEYLKKGHTFEQAKVATQEEMNGSMKTLIETVLSMYEGVSSRTIHLMQERNARKKAENALHEANIKLKALSITDQLTQLYNRRHFDEVLASEFHRAKRMKTSLSLILFDIDFFKRLNDEYGHAYGDRALESVGQCLKKMCKRPCDFAFRIGGEEFVVLTTIEDDSHESLATLIVKAIAHLKIPNKKSSVSEYLTVSVGVVSKIPSESDTTDSFMKLADEKLYEAKENGRNQIIRNN